MRIDLPGTQLFAMYEVGLHLILLVLSVPLCIAEESFQVVDSGITQLNAITLKYEWTIKNFSTIAARVPTNISILSEEFSSPIAPTDKFHLAFYPSGDYRSTKEDVGVYLHYRGKKKEIALHCDFYILNNTREKVIEKRFQSKWLTSEFSWGYWEIAKKGFLLNKSNKILTKDDELVVVAAIWFLRDSTNYRSDCSTEDCDPKSSLSQRLGKFIHNEEYSDVELIVEGYKLRAHKLILAASSSVFAASFKTQKNRDGILTMDIDDVKFEVMKEVLQFIYTSEPPAKLREMAVDLLYVADSFGIEDLRELTEGQLCKDLNINNAYDMLILGDKLKSENLKKRASQLIASESFNIISTVPFQTIINANPTCVANALRLEEKNKLIDNSV